MDINVANFSKLYKELFKERNISTFKSTEFHGVMQHLYTFFFSALNKQLVS